MASERDAERQPRGKVLLFRRLLSGRSSAGKEAKALEAEHAARIRRARVALWFNRAWIVAAWFIAASRVHRASVSREVFGVEASLAFVVAVAVPLVRVRALAAVVGEVATALRRRRLPSGGPPDPKSHAA